jgi:hypothetical protein
LSVLRVCLPPKIQKNTSGRAITPHRPAGENGA